MAQAPYRRGVDAGAIAHAMNLLGNRWTFHILRELIFGGRRFSHLMTGLPGISPNVLSLRLRQLETAGLVAKRELAEPVAQQLYELTEVGEATGPVLRALSRWGGDEPAFNPHGGTTSASVLLTMQVSFDSERAQMPHCSLGLSLGQEAFVIRVTSHGLVITRVDRISGVDAVMAADTASFQAAVAGVKSASDLGREGLLTIGGDVTLFDRLFLLLQPARHSLKPALDLVGI